MLDTLKRCAAGEAIYTPSSNELVMCEHARSSQRLAEGIETREELEALCELGVDYGQGYFLARPGPLEEVAALEIAV